MKVIQPYRISAPYQDDDYLDFNDAEFYYEDEPEETPVSFITPSRESADALLVHTQRDSFMGSVFTYLWLTSMLLTLTFFVLEVSFNYQWCEDGFIMSLVAAIIFFANSIDSTT